MKNNKTIGVLFLVLAVLLGIFLLRMYLPKSSADNKTYLEWWEEIKPEAVTNLTVKQADTELSLHKDNSHWKIGEIPVDETKVDDLLTKLLQPTEVTVVAVTGAQHDSLGVASGAAILTLKTDTTEKAIRLGNPSTSGRYVRLGDMDTVYLVTQLPTGIDSTNQNEWVDKIITKIPEDKIKSLTVKDKAQETVLERRDAKWFLQGSDTELDSTNFGAALSTLSSLSTQGLADIIAEKNYPTTPTVTVTVHRTEGDPVTLTFYTGTNDSLVSSSERPGKYTLSSSVVDNFTLKAEDLKPKPSPSPTQNP